ncbi:hypothetical protein [Streptomyces sp. NPDC097981]|uniref:hypothetical protein n=1 Tax=Streptomyces sp. NPDC097981 TaxID=3155428 RepID=UPI003321AD91
MLSWTGFATGDSYATTAFSTRTAIPDLRTGDLVTSMEQVPLTIDGVRHHSPDVNYGGVTFETPLAETRSMDDRAAWPDEGTLAYALPGAQGRASDIRTVPADGRAAPPYRRPGRLVTGRAAVSAARPPGPERPKGCPVNDLRVASGMAGCRAACSLIRRG